MLRSRRLPLLMPVATAVLYGFLFFLTDHDFLISFTHADPTFANTAAESISEGTLTRPAAMFVLTLSALFFLGRKQRPDFQIHKAILLVVLLYWAWGMLSYFWADDSYLVLKRLLSFSALLLAAFAISRTVKRHDFLLIVFFISCAYLAIGVVTEKVLGNLNLLADGYRFMGTTHPESQGFNCAALFLSSVAISDSKKRAARLFFRSVGVIGLAFLILTRSRGPFAATLIATVVYLYLTRKRLNSCTMLYLSLLISSFSVLLLGWPEFKGALLLGREEHVADLTGRIPLWVECWGFVAKRPLTGYGFNGFWTESRSLEIAKSQGWFGFSGHSIYMDTLLNLGFVGLVLVLVILGISVARGFRTARCSGDHATAFLVGLLLLMCIDGLLASLVVAGGFVTFLLFSAVFFLCFSDTSPRAEPSQGGVGGTARR